MARPNKAVVKKVKAYPFAVALKSASGEALAGHALKATLSGIMIELAPGVSVKAGERFDLTFELPALKATIATQATLVKLYNQLGVPAGAAAPAAPASNAPPAAPGAHVLLRIAEFHFRGISDENVIRLRAFLAAIGAAQ